MTRRLLTLALVVAVAASGAVLFADAPARAAACTGSCSMQVPTGTPSCTLVWNGAFVEVVCTGGNVWISTNCVASPSACFCPYEGQGLPLVNGCPDPKP